MWSVWSQKSTMWLGALLTLLLCSRLQSQENSFTINSIHMESLPQWRVQNGQSVHLQCTVDISTTSLKRPQHQVLFYKDDVVLRNVSSVKNAESFFISQARVHDSGMYKCTVLLNNKKKTSEESRLLVQGMPKPKVTLDKREAIEGGVVTVNCSVPGERAPIYFKVEKFERDPKTIKLTKEKNSLEQNFVTVEFPIGEQDYVLYFTCQASISLGFQTETSETTRSEEVTVTESFSTPRFHVSPRGVITEGDQLEIKCTIQVTPLAHETPEIIIQKDKAIVAHSSRGSEVAYSAMAMVEHNGNYTCKVESSRLSKVNSIVVNITELFPKPKLESSSVRVDQGERLDLRCSIPGAPPANFTIEREGTIMSLGQNFTKITDGWESGTYTCSAGVGKVVKKSNAVQIKVCGNISKPRIFHDTKSEIIKGQAVRISCQSENGTSPITYYLLRGSDILENITKTSNDPAVFRDNPTEDADYKCVADNCHSHLEASSEALSIKVIAPVHQVKLSILRNSEVETGKEIVLQCSVTEGTGPITYRFYKDKDSKPFHQTISNDTQVIWYKEQASKEQEGQYYCIAFNKASVTLSSSHSNVLMVKVFLASWKKVLITVVVLGVVIGALIVGAKCYVLRKAKAKQMPVEMSRPAVPLLKSNNEKVAEPSSEANSHYGYNDEVGNHAMKQPNESKADPVNSDVEYTEVEVSPAEPHQVLGTRGTDTVYSEIRKAEPRSGEHRYSRTEGSLDGS
ncbi:platelet endothelial cell adhesion molecule isoform X1 [Octodon degus]|uniref:Platelet endothelial cell adhesion molecule n=1 Tax=Octodon degus TaxID=10160 RepID=A0A6P6EBC1_OCTDE|nr:platelet endothelial cell adhesion molecule isoform X1 [Octodon degus]XP_023569635.1 platelet endothelial cell adhesion molecule isoform X1 [Octodon degus]XP_023569636.1 platelet endothelial cell adhesion molecule isoform X1 [Octodon degus]